MLCILIFDVNFEAFTAVMFQVKVFWDVTPCSVLVGYQRFRGPCCLHLQGEVKASHPRRPQLEILILENLK